MARKGCHDQHHRLALDFFQGCGVVGKALETAQFAEGFAEFYPLMDGDVHAIHVDGAQAEFGLFVVLAQAVHQVVAGGQALGKGVLSGHGQRVAIQLGRRQCQIGKRLHQGALGFVELVQHERLAFGKMLQCNITGVRKSAVTCLENPSDRIAAVGAEVG